MTAALNITNFSTTITDNDALVENGYVTIQGVTGILPRYYNTHITSIDSQVTINAATNSIIDIQNSSYSQNSNIMINDAQNSIVIANNNTGQLNINKRSDNLYHTYNGMIISSAVGNNTINSVYGGVIIFGSNDPSAEDSNLILTAGIRSNLTSGSLFVAGAGNETLDGSTSQGDIQVWANTNVNSNLIASTR